VDGIVREEKANPFIFVKSLHAHIWLINDQKEYSEFEGKSCYIN